MSEYSRSSVHYWGIVHRGTRHGTLGGGPVLQRLVRTVMQASDLSSMTHNPSRNGLQCSVWGRCATTNFKVKRSPRGDPYGGCHYGEVGDEPEFRKVLGVLVRYLFMYFFPLLGEREFKA